MTDREPTDLNLESALLDPASSFRRPEDVLTRTDLGLKEKIEILYRWAYDAAELAVAEEEGMGGGETSNLGAVIAALHDVTGGFDAARSAPTKHGSLWTLRPIKAVSRTRE